MSVNIEFKKLTNEDRWSSLKNGDFVIIENSPDHPIPNGLYRIFLIPDQTERFLMPMFDGPFEIGLFPYMVSNPVPKIQETISRVSIHAEVY